jgi:hypothetical protein
MFRQFGIFLGTAAQKSNRKIPNCRNSSKIQQKNTKLSEHLKNPTEKSYIKGQSISLTQIHDRSHLVFYVNFSNISAISWQHLHGDFISLRREGGLGAQN